MNSLVMADQLSLSPYNPSYYNTLLILIKLSWPYKDSTNNSEHGFTLAGSPPHRSNVSKAHHKNKKNYVEW